MMIGTLRAALVYFALVLGAGFMLRVIRVPFIVPRIGERWVAELALAVGLQDRSRIECLARLRLGS